VILSPLPGVVNTLSITFSVTSHVKSNVRSLNSMMILRIFGLIQTDTPDLDTFNDLDKQNTPIHSAIWRKDSGALFLRLNGTLLENTAYAFSFNIRNVESAQSAVLPTIALGRLEDPASDSGFTYVVPAVGLQYADGSTSPLAVYANFSLLRLGQNTASFSADNTLSLTMASRYGLSFDPSTSLTLRGLFRSSTPSGALQVTSSYDRLVVQAMWNQTRGSLVCTFVDKTVFEPGQEVVLSFNLRNPERPQASPVVSVFVSQIIPEWIIVDQASGLHAPLLVAGIVSAGISQTSASQGAENTIRVHLQLQTRLPAQSTLVISGLTGSTTEDTDELGISVAWQNRTDLVQWMPLTDQTSPFSLVASWNRALGQVRVEIIPSMLEALTNYSIEFKITNPLTAQPSPAGIQVWGEGIVAMAALEPARALGNRAPVAVIGFATAVLKQSEISIERKNTLTLSLKTLFADLEAETEVTLAGLRGAVPEACADADTCFMNEFFISAQPDDGTWSESAVWEGTADSANLVVRLLRHTTPGQTYLISFDLLNSGSAQRSPTISISACCATVVKPIPITRALEEQAPFLIAGCLVANMTQSSAAQGVMNILSLNLSFNVRLKTSFEHKTEVVIWGLIGSATRSADSFDVKCSGDKLGNARWESAPDRGILRLVVRNEIPAEEVVTCHFTLQNPLKPQVAPPVFVQLMGQSEDAIQGEVRAMSSSEVIESRPLFVHGWTYASIMQSSPSALTANTLTVSLRSMGTLNPPCFITLHGLIGTNTPPTSMLLLNTESPLAAAGVWHPGNGTLLVELISPLSAHNNASFSFVVRNPRVGQDAVDAMVEVEGIIHKAPLQRGKGNSAPLLIAVSGGIIQPAS
jgi:hypothetical protein